MKFVVSQFTLTPQQQAQPQTTAGTTLTTTTTPIKTNRNCCSTNTTGNTDTEAGNIRNRSYHQCLMARIAECTAGASNPVIVERCGKRERPRTGGKRLAREPAENRLSGGRKLMEVRAGAEKPQLAAGAEKPSPREEVEKRRDGSAVVERAFPASHAREAKVVPKKGWSCWRPTNTHEVGSSSAFKSAGVSSLTVKAPMTGSTSGRNSASSPCT